MTPKRFPYSLKWLDGKAPESRDLGAFLYFTVNIMHKTLILGPCDGLSEERTLKWQLIKAGIIKDCTEWGKSHLEDPRSVFHFFKHHASDGYAPDFVDSADPDSHCGVCFHRIDYSFVFRSKTNDPFQAVWVNEKGEDVPILFPVTMISGSECIHLANELKSLIAACRKKFNAFHISFEDGLIDMDSILKHADEWTVDVAAFPLEWFYFSPSLRDRLVWWQHSGHGGYGAHVEQSFDRKTILQRCKAALDYYSQYEDENSRWINGRIFPKHLQRAHDLFYGKDKFGKIATRGTYFQPQTETKYVILTKQKAMRLYGK